MSREKSLLLTTIIYTISNVVSRISIFILLIVSTRYLSASQYGYYDLVISSTNILAPIITIQIADAVFRFLLTETKEKFKKQIISSAAIFIIAGTIVFTLLFLILFPIISLKHIANIYLVIVSWALFVFLQQTARGFHKPGIYSISGIIYSLVLFLVSAVLIMFTSLRIEALLIANTIASVVGGVYLLFKIKLLKYLSIKEVDYDYIKKMAKYSIPLLVGAIFWWIVLVANRYFISYFIGIDQNGIFAVAAKFASIISFANGIFYLAWQESAIQEFESDDRSQYYNKMLNTFIKVQFSLLLVLLAISRIAIKHSVGIAYSNAWEQLPFLYFGAVFSGLASFYGSIYLGAGKTMNLLFITSVGAGTAVLLNMVLIPFIGIWGASISNVVSFAVICFIITQNIKKFVHIHLSMKTFFMYSIYGTVFSLLSYLKNIYIDSVMFAVSIVMAIIWNKSIILTTFLYIKDNLKKFNSNKIEKIE